jgi:ATP-binding cassette subfamily B protein
MSQHSARTEGLSPFVVLTRGARLVRRHVRHHRAVFATAVLGAVAFTSAIVASAYVIGAVSDSLIIPVLRDGEPLEGRLLGAVGLIVGVAVWKSVGIVVRRASATYLQVVAQNDVRKELVRHELGLTLRWYGSRPTGDLLSVTDNDARGSTWVLAPLPFATGVVFLILGTAVVLTVTDPWIGLAGIVLLAVVSALNIRGSWLTFTMMQDIQRRRGRVGDIAHESFDGALTVKALGREDVESARFDAASDHLRRGLVEIGRTWNGYRVLTEGLPVLGAVAILALGVWRLSVGAIGTGEVVRVMYLLSLIGGPLRLVGYLMWDMAHSVASFDRVQEVLDIDDAVEFGDAEPRPAAGAAPVTGTAVGFGYDPAEPVLRDVAIDVPAGRTLAVVGPTGSGKSTLTLLLARLWDPDSGAIRVGGRDLRELRQGGVPAEVAYVAQDTFLFDDTVRENIALGRDLETEEIVEAARTAGADGFIRALPQGYDTPLGERGATLSGGQRQRIALARALARRPRVLVLDDATSALDPSVETAILRRLRSATSPSTVVVVAYRRSSIVLADEVVFVDAGRVVAHGTHQQLLAQVPGYADLLEAYERDHEARVEEGAA